ncbi:hypothetical protein [Brockia lithotrophica]|uniref:Uncharacterized protein n=1 Tax=Brockia lithotrophica TaxID=933949 RepID=A0A660KW53_9BACL|nr:hypothetical protein [Brockia lithotrophica]RKQ83672.1 hypothetical protein C7438_1702 [Brockia lithotrophica]
MGSSSARRFFPFILGALFVLALGSEAFARPGERHFLGTARADGMPSGIERSAHVENLERIVDPLRLLSEKSYTVSGEVEVRTKEGYPVLAARLTGVHDPSRGFSVAVVSGTPEAKAEAQEVAPYDEVAFFEREGRTYMRFADEAAWRPVSSEEQGVAREELSRWDPRDHAERLVRYAVRVTPVTRGSSRENREVWEILLDGTALARDRAAGTPTGSRVRLSAPLSPEPPSPPPTVGARYLLVLDAETRNPVELRYEERVHLEPPEGAAFSPEEEVHTLALRFHAFDREVQFPDLLGIEQP